MPFTIVHYPDYECGLCNLPAREHRLQNYTGDWIDTE
jgi:hypothetical protein